MQSDIFGDLRDWGRALDQIAELRSSGKLDEHQEELARVLRYRDNWRLREAALEAAEDISSPSDEILSQVLAIMMDEGVYWQARVLAADTLSHLIKKHDNGPERALSLTEAKVIEKMNMILGSPQPPIFHESVRRFLRAIEETKGPLSRKVGP